MRRLWLLCVAVACSVSSEQKSFDAPAPDGFRYVSNMLHSRCGSLDCHGQVGRSLRLYGRFGLRLDPNHIPGVAKDTQAEHDANYSSVLSLEPEIMATVFHDGGRDPQRLTLVRKGRHSESHKGGEALDALGVDCIVSWLEGKVDAKLCEQAAILEKPPGFVVPNTGGSGGTNTGGTGGTPSGGTGGLGGSGGTATGGTTASGGAAGGGGGGGCGGSEPPCPVDFWPASHDASCLPPKPTPADHSAYTGTECLTCHSAAGSAVPFLAAGVIWEWGGKKGQEQIEVGLRDGEMFIYTCTDPKGFFSVPAAGSPVPDWLKVETRMRSALGEKIMPSDKEHKPTCNSSKCHGALDHQLWAP